MYNCKYIWGLRMSKLIALWSMLLRYCSSFWILSILYDKQIMFKHITIAHACFFAWLLVMISDDTIVWSV